MKPELPVPCLCLVTDLRLFGSDVRELERRVASAVKGGVNLVQLREKGLPGGRLLDLAERLRVATRGSALLFVNDRVDVALACGADGVQLGEEGIPVSAARRIAGDGLLIGRSVHSVDGARDAVVQVADLLVAGTIFSTGSHPGAEPVGPDILSRISDETSLPLLGIGGITAANVGRVVEAGACGAAVISAILAAGDPERASRDLREAIGVAWSRRQEDQRSVSSAPARDSGRY